MPYTGFHSNTNMSRPTSETHQSAQTHFARILCSFSAPIPTHLKNSQGFENTIHNQAHIRIPYESDPIGFPIYACIQAHGIRNNTPMLISANTSGHPLSAKATCISTPYNPSILCKVHKSLQCLDSVSLPHIQTADDFWWHHVKRHCQGHFDSQSHVLLGSTCHRT